MMERVEDILKAFEFQTAAYPLNITEKNVQNLQVYLSTYFLQLKLLSL